MGVALLPPSEVSYGSASEKCAVKGEFTQLTSMLPGDKTLTDMRNICHALGGVPYGHVGEMCACRGQSASPDFLEHKI